MRIVVGHARNVVVAAILMSRAESARTAFRRPGSAPSAKVAVTTFGSAGLATPRGGGTATDATRRGSGRATRAMEHSSAPAVVVEPKQSPCAP